MNAEESPFQAGWLSFDLEGYRECDNTYCLVAYDTLPPLPGHLFRGAFQWLTPLDRQLQEIMEEHRSSSMEGFLSSMPAR